MRGAEAIRARIGDTDLLALHPGIRTDCSDRSSECGENLRPGVFRRTGLYRHGIFPRRRFAAPHCGRHGTRASSTFFAGRPCARCRARARHHSPRLADNLMLRADGSIGLVDFGVAKRARESMGLTRHGQVVGTPFYLSPEQAQYTKVTPQSDLYSLGVMAFEMFTGESHSSRFHRDLMRQHVGAPGVPACASACASDADRPLDGEKTARPVSPTRASWKPISRVADICRAVRGATRAYCELEAESLTEASMILAFSTPRQMRCAGCVGGAAPLCCCPWRCSAHMAGIGVGRHGSVRLGAALHLLRCVHSHRLPGRARHHQRSGGFEILSHWFRALPVAAVPVYVVTLVWAMQVFATAPSHGQDSSAGLVDGTVAGALAINTAHELIHKSTRLEQWLGGFLLCCVGYATFKIEHVHGHHQWVATPRDPSTAKKGESVFLFFRAPFVKTWRMPGGFK